MGQGYHAEVSDTYLKLVKRFPLIHIRDKAHLGEAIELLSDLLRQERDQGRRSYLDVLTDLVAAYEDEHIPMPDVSEADVPSRTDAVQPAQPDAVGEGSRDGGVQRLGRPDRGLASLTKGQISSSPSSSPSRRQPFFREISVRPEERAPRR